MRSVCVFCGSRTGTRPVFAAAARQLGQAIAARDLRLVYGGGHIGLMGVVADAALAAGGQVIGVIPDALLARELAHTGLTELHVVSSMHARKARMAELSDGFIALPGGYGTLDEFCEILTWAQFGIHHKPCVLLDIDGYFAALRTFLAHAVGEGFLAPSHHDLVRVATAPEQSSTSYWEAPHPDNVYNCVQLSPGARRFRNLSPRARS